MFYQLKSMDPKLKIHLCAGCAHNGSVDEAFELLQQMQHENV